jgi:Cupin superfamily protein
LSPTTTPRHRLPAVRHTAAASFSFIQVKTLSSSSSSSSLIVRGAGAAAAMATAGAKNTLCDAPPPVAESATVNDINRKNINGNDDEDNRSSNASDDDDDDILVSLFGSQIVCDEFLNQWRHDDENVFHRHISRTTTTTTTTTTSTNNNSNRIMSSRPPPPLSGIDLHSLYETSNFISLRIRGSHDILCKNTTTYHDLCQYIDSGGSAIVSITESDYLYPFKVLIQKALGRVEDEVSMNVYHSGPNAVALNLHYDSYNVIVLQLAGQKEWILQDDNGGQRRPELDSISAWRNVTMIPGDVLYIPKVVFHAATTKPSSSSLEDGTTTTTTTTTSTHVTIGLS